MSVIALRYARALVDVIFSSKLDAGKAMQDLRDVSQLVQSSHDLRSVWDSPSVPADQKMRLLDSVASKSIMAKQVRNFIAILIEKRRLGQMPEIILQVQAELNDRLGFADADVSSARTLGDEERKTLESSIAKVSGKTVRAKYRQDKDLLGGALVKVGSTIYDGSVRGQLQKIKAQIAGR